MFCRECFQNGIRWNGVHNETGEQQQSNNDSDDDNGNGNDDNGVGLKFFFKMASKQKLQKAFLCKLSSMD